MHPPVSKRKRHSQFILFGVLIALALTALAWAFFMEDFDFYRPDTVLRCESAPIHSKPLRFIAFGDFGQGTPFQKKLGEVMASTYQQHPFSLALLLGDNIYPNGDIQRLAKTHFENPYATLIDRKVRFIAAIGDHDDHQGHIKDEKAYFRMPNDYYQVSQGPVDFFVLNTTYFVRNPKQRAWIQQALAKSKARWKIVIGHHPLYSSGRNGNTEGLKAILEPLLVQRGVQLYLSGHDHDYERFQPVNGVHYIVSGGGGSYLYNFKRILPNSQVHLKTHHFLMFEVTQDDLWMKAINRHGNVIDCVHWRH